MDYKLSEFTIVILASANNPSILNPDFLRINNIVQEDFQAVEIISTPPFSLVKYKEKIDITVDMERLTFIDADEKRIPFESPIPLIATRYMNVLKLVPYKAVGINFNGYYECSHVSPPQFILEKFIKTGAWSEHSGVQPSIGLKFSYKMDEVTFNLKIAPAVTVKGERSFQSIAISSNFHYDPKDKAVEKMTDYVTNWESKYRQLNDFLMRIFQ